MALLVILPALTAGLPLSAAAASVPPEPAGWGSYTAANTVNDLVIARAGSTIVVGVAAPDAPSVPDGLPGTQAQTTDVHVLTREGGFLFNGSVTGVPQGKVAVAASADGGTVAAGGPESESTHKVYAWKASAEDVSAAGTKDPAWSANLPGPVVGLALSRDGKSLAAASNPSGGGSVVFFDNDQRVFETTGGVIAGPLNDLAMDATADNLVAGGVVSQESTAFGAVYYFSIPRSTPLKHTITNSGTEPEVQDVAITPDGRIFAAVTSGGRVLVYDKPSAGATSLQPRVSLDVPEGRARQVALSDDAETLAVAGDLGVAVYRRQATGYGPAWNLTLANAVTRLDVDAAGGVVMVATSGQGGATIAYSALEGLELWRVSGPAESAALTANASGAVVLQGRSVRAYGLPSVVSLTRETGETPDLNPFQSAAFDLTLSNDGATPLTLDLIGPQSGDVAFEIQPTRASLLPGDTQTVQVTAHPGRLPPGLYSYKIRAVDVDGRTEANATISFSIRPTSSLGVVLNGALERDIGQGDNDNILLDLINEGNSALQVGVGVRQDASPPWNVRLVGEPDFRLGAGAFDTVRVLVDTPQRVENGTVNTVSITVSSGDHSETRDVRYVVNPVVSANVTTRGLAKVLAPGDQGLFNLTVTNTGTITHSFVVTQDTKSTDGRTWVVDVDSTPFPLAPGEDRIVPLRVYAPRDGDLGDRATITVTVTSALLHTGGEPPEDTLTLFANVQPRTVSRGPETETETPAPAAFLTFVLLGLVAGALSPKRRRL